MSPLPSAPPPDGRIGETTLSSQFIQLPDTPTNWYTNWEQIQSGYGSQVSTTVAYSTHQVSSQSLQSKRFPIFPAPPSDSPNVARSGCDLK